MGLCWETGSLVIDQRFSLSSSLLTYIVGNFMFKRHLERGRRLQQCTVCCAQDSNFLRRKGHRSEAACDVMQIRHRNVSSLQDLRAHDGEKPIFSQTMPWSVQINCAWPTEPESELQPVAKQDRTVFCSGAVLKSDNRPDSEVIRSRRSSSVASVRVLVEL